jgi:prepilin-type processing-associated H-X9-DG protein
MRLGRAAFTLIETLTVAAVSSTLALLLLASLQHARKSADQTTCVSNLRQWGMALGMYTSDHDSVIPGRGQGVQPVELVDRPDDWFNALPPYFSVPSYSEQVAMGKPARQGDKSVFVCPTAVNTGKYPHFLCYGMNMNLSYTQRSRPHRLVELPNLSQLAFMADGPSGWSSTIPSSQPYSVQARHQGKANVVFADGHVQTFKGEYLACGVGGPERERPDIRWKTLTTEDFRDVP